MNNELARKNQHVKDVLQRAYANNIIDKSKYEDLMKHMNKLDVKLMNEKNK